MGWVRQIMGCDDIQIQYMTSIRDFVPLAKLGEGTFSTVYKVRRVSDQKIYAIKKVRMRNLSDRQKENALNEIRILASFECENIVAYKEAFFDEKLNVLCIVMQFADGGDLQKLISNAKKDFRKISERDIWTLAKDILTALTHLHAKGILHRDIKSANIFIHGTLYKLGDLNVSKANGGSLAYTQTGTPYYASPQVWRDIPYDSKSDIWSFGCIIYEMAALTPPFNGKDMEQLYRNVQKGYYKPISRQYSSQLCDFIAQCLRKDPHSRPSASKLLENHVISRLTGQNQSQIAESSIQQSQLLRTIKLPTDLKVLKANLPEPKYENKQEDDSIRDSKNYKSDRPYLSPEKKHKIGLNDFLKNHSINQSQLFTSPRNVNKSNVHCNGRSPEDFLNRKIVSAHHHYSEKKLQNYSDRKQTPSHHNIYKRPSSHQRSELIDKYDKFIRQQTGRRPAGIPRTQKGLVSNCPIGPGREVIQEWKKKLVKKSRILSSNNVSKPYWMK